MCYDLHPSFIFQVSIMHIIFFIIMSSLISIFNFLIF